MKKMVRRMIDFIAYFSHNIDIVIDSWSKRSKITAQISKMYVQSSLLMCQGLTLMR